MLDRAIHHLRGIIHHKCCTFLNIYDKGCKYQVDITLESKVEFYYFSQYIQYFYFQLSSDILFKISALDSNLQNKKNIYNTNFLLCNIYIKIYIMVYRALYKYFFDTI